MIDDSSVRQSHSIVEWDGNVVDYLVPLQLGSQESLITHPPVDLRHSRMKSKGLLHNCCEIWHLRGELFVCRIRKCVDFFSKLLLDLRMH
jgi:hypothetical protein